MSYRVEVDEGLCSAHGDCAAVAPQIFALEDTAVVVGDGPDELMLAAAESCPALAISVTDSESGEVVFP
jgi:ferredoxin